MLDATAEIGKQQEVLEVLTKKKSALWELLRKESDVWNKKQREALEQKGIVARVKSELKQTEDEMRTVKAFLRSQQQYG
jgi:hypothetical protein